MEYIDNPAILSQELSSLELELFTIKVSFGESDDDVFVNVVFADDTRLYEPENLNLGSPPDGGETKRWVLPVPPGLGRTLGSISEVFLRKEGSDGWCLGSALLFANGIQD